MFGRRAEVREPLSNVIDTSPEKRATSADRAMIIQKLGPFSKFDGLMKRCKGRLGIFVGVEGRYCSPVECLKEAGEKRLKQRFRRW
jgi:hypothetical protein